MGGGGGVGNAREGEAGRRERSLTCQFTLGGLERQPEELLVQLEHLGFADDLREAVVHVMHLQEGTSPSREKVLTLSFRVRL